MRTDVASQAPPVQPNQVAVRRPVVHFWLWATSTIVCLAAFTVLQFFVERRAHSSWVSLPGGARDVEVDWSMVRYQFAGDVGRFLGLSLAGMALVIRGRRKIFWSPVVAYSVAPLLLLSWGGDCERLWSIPASIGAGWTPLGLGCDSIARSTWGPAVLDVILVLVPAFVLAWSTKGRAGAASSGPLTSTLSGSPTPFQLASLGFAGFAAGALLWSWQLAGVVPSSVSTQLATLLPLLVFGVLLASLRPTLAWTLPVAGALLATNWMSLLVAGAGFSGTGWQGVVSSIPYSWPFLVLPVVAASWAPVARGLNTLANRPRRAFVLLNGLNIIDAALTTFAVRAEGAVEANPLVRMIGLPAKIVLVCGLSILVLHVRPRAMTWLVLVFSGVLVWHLAGFLASPR